jgi:nitrous oxidase accessory protein NosD
MSRGSWLRGLCVVAVLLSSSLAQAALRRVPQHYRTIQAAVDAARDGDRIRVSPGAYCGATVTKRVTLEGQGRARIIGCEGGPTVTPRTRVGFFLPGSQGVNPASGTSISGFVFDGRGVSNANLAPLSFGIFARFANDVVVSRNRFLGTVQAITNTAGDRWRIQHNRISELTVLDCTGLCTGGIGIVLGLSSGGLAAPGGSAAAANRAEDNLIVGNVISGSAPDGFGMFSLAGILVLSADYTTVLSNRLQMRDNPAADAVGQGILVTNTCCGLASGLLPGSRHTTLAYNDGRKSERAIVVEGSGGTNTEALFMHHNRGEVIVEGDQIQALALRRAAAPAGAQPTL